MEILEGDALYRALLQRYSRNPLGWSFTVSPSLHHGFFDALVGCPGESWRLKLDTIFKPSPLSLGARTDEALSGGDLAPLSFGFRRVDLHAATALLDDSPQGVSRLLTLLAAVKPVAPTGPGTYIQGPYLYTSRAQPGGSITAEQQRVDSRLSEEMRELVRRRYPSYL
jgi:hypothetical protein